MSDHPVNQASPSTLDELRAALHAAGLSPMNPRSTNAIARFRIDGVPAQECFEGAIEQEKAARERWIAEVLDPWCARHGLNRVQAISVAFLDNEPGEDPLSDHITLDVLHNGAYRDFAAYLIRESKEQAKARPNLAAAMTGPYPPRASDPIDFAGPLFDTEGARHQLVRLSSREVVTVLGSGFHVIWDRETLEAKPAEAGLALRSTPLSEREEWDRQEKLLAVLRGSAPAPTQAPAVEPAPVAISHVAPRVVHVPAQVSGRQLVERTITYWLVDNGETVGSARLPDNTSADKVREHACLRASQAPMYGMTERCLTPLQYEMSLRGASVVVYNDGVSAHSAFFKSAEARREEVEGPCRILALVNTFVNDSAYKSQEIDVTEDALALLEEGSIPCDGTFVPGDLRCVLNLPEWTDATDISRFKVTVEQSMRAFLAEAGRLELLEPIEVVAPRG